MRFLPLILLCGCATPQEIDKMEERWHEDRKVDMRLFHKAETLPLLQENHRVEMEAIATLEVTIDAKIASSEDTSEGLLDTAFHTAADAMAKQAASQSDATARLRAALDRATSRHVAVQDAHRDELSRFKGRMEEKADTALATLAGLVTNMVDYKAVAKTTAGALADLARDADALKRAHDAAVADEAKRDKAITSRLIASSRARDSQRWEDTESKLFKGVAALAVILLAGGAVVAFFRKGKSERSR